MIEIKRTAEIVIKPTVREVADAFCSMDSKEQAQFFSLIYETVKGTWERPFCIQLESVSKEPSLSDGGRYIMNEIGNYSIKETD